MVNKKDQVITTYKVTTYRLNSKHFVEETSFAFVGLRHTPPGLAVKSSLHVNMPPPQFSNTCLADTKLRDFYQLLQNALHYDVHVPAGVTNIKTRTGIQMIRMKKSYTSKEKLG